MAKRTTKTSTARKTTTKAAEPAEVVKNVEQTPREATEAANKAVEQMSDEEKALHLDDMRARRSALGY